jgi:hypothetical protein
MEFKTVDVDMVVLANTLLDYMAEVYGAKETINYLLDMDYSPDEVYSLAFDQETIQNILEEREGSNNGEIL